ncbi:hypothetical protein [Kangiella geojedonensis]|uniref:Uncharacterized protein n=1 Tax=Kangiella geojedonensis TaxID=914150 RepID=A0A0F6RCT6_9GAMM|nr:hypothetical protein [Kangiella geojedonensis]AKE52708.1 hypothetical protein TQ33_1767 [Kangiella geojedonensis]
MVNKFNIYNFKARILPLAYISIPIALITLVHRELLSTVQYLYTFLGWTGLLFLLSNYVSLIGNKIQTKIFEYLGAEPTTIILRHHDDRIDNITKKRYHDFLSLALNIQMPTYDEESSDPHGSDEKYRSATNYLRESTRDNNKFPLVFADNVAYGFMRNLFALKSAAIVISLLCLIYLIFLTTLTFVSSSIFSEIGRTPLILCLILNTLYLINTISFVTMDIVTTRAFRYAKSLLGACDNL